MKADVYRVAVHVPAAGLGVFLDTNVLRFQEYPSDLQLGTVLSPVTTAQLQYGTWLARLWRGKGTAYTTSVCMGELATLIERTELRARLIKRTGAKPSDVDIKNERLAMFAAGDQSIRTDVSNVLAHAKVNTISDVKDLSAGPSSRTLIHSEWAAAAADWNDAILVATAKAAVTPWILSDDADLVSFAGISLLTANQGAINAAAAAGKLQN